MRAAQEAGYKGHSDAGNAGCRWEEQKQDGEPMHRRRHERSARAVHLGSDGFWRGFAVLESAAEIFANAPFLVIAAHLTQGTYIRSSTYRAVLASFSFHLH
jgi:hypothetical protein